MAEKIQPGRSNEDRRCHCTAIQKASPDIATRRRGPRARRAVDDATRDPRPDQAVAARAGCASRPQKRITSTYTVKLIRARDSRFLATCCSVLVGMVRVASGTATLPRVSGAPREEQETASS